MPQQDSAVYRAILTFLEAILGFMVGLIVVVWQVPEVPHVVIMYVLNNLPQVLLLVGIPSGLSSLLLNLWRKNVPNY